MFFFPTAKIAGTRFKWCSYCLVHRQFTQSKRSRTPYNATRRHLSIGRCIAECWDPKSRLSFHLRHEFVEIFKFWLRIIAAHFKFTQSKSHFSHNYLSLYTFSAYIWKSFDFKITLPALLIVQRTVCMEENLFLFSA